MAKQNNTILWILGVLIVSALLVGPQLGLFTIGEASMTRSIPSTIQPGQQFNVIYTTSASGKWGASVIDSVSGGCEFPDGSSQLKTVMLSTDGDSKTIKVTAPSSGSCTFSGDYKFGTEATKDFIDDTITITTENGNGNDINGDGEETICCKITMVLGPEYQPVVPSYEWTTKSYCEEMVVGASRIIVDDSHCENGDGNGNGEIPTFDLNQVLFKIGDFGVTILHLIIFIVGLFILQIILPKK